MLNAMKKYEAVVARIQAEIELHSTASCQHHATSRFDNR